MTPPNQVLQLIDRFERNRSVRNLSEYKRPSLLSLYENHPSAMPHPGRRASHRAKSAQSLGRVQLLQIYEGLDIVLEYIL